MATRIDNRPIRTSTQTDKPQTPCPAIARAGFTIIALLLMMLLTTAIMLVSCFRLN